MLKPPANLEGYSYQAHLVVMNLTYYETALCKFKSTVFHQADFHVVGENPFQKIWMYCDQNKQLQKQEFA